MNRKTKMPLNLFLVPMALCCGLNFDPVQAEIFTQSSALAESFISNSGGTVGDFDSTSTSGLTVVALENSRAAASADATAATSIGSNKALVNAQLFADEPAGVNVSAIGQAISWWRDTVTIAGGGSGNFIGSMTVQLDGTLFSAGEDGSSVVDFELIWDSTDDNIGEQTARYFNNFNSSGGLILINESVTLDFEFEAGTPTTLDGYLQVTAGYSDTLGIATTDFFGTATLIAIDLPAGFLLTTESGTQLPLAAPVPLPPAIALLGFGVACLIKLPRPWSK